MLGVLVAVVPPLFAVVVDASSWRIAFAVAALGPLAGLLVLRRVSEEEVRVNLAALRPRLRPHSRGFRASESARADSDPCGG
jgi:hypothetical protein